MKDRQRQVKYVALDAFRAASATPSGLTDLAASLGTKPESLAVRAAFPVELVKDDAQDAPVSFVISTETPDREKDSIKVDGWDLAAYKRTPTVLFAHDYSSLPVGRAPDIHVADGKLKSGPITFVPAEVYPFADTVRQMVKLGFLGSASVGFRPLKSSWNEERRGVDFEKQELLEFSIVPVPANAECLVEARAAGIDVEPLREWAERTLETFGTVAKIGLGEVTVMRAERGDPGRTRTVASKRRAMRRQMETPMALQDTIVALADIASDVAAIPPLLSGGSEPELYQALGMLVDIHEDCEDVSDALLEALDAGEPAGGEAPGMPMGGTAAVTGAVAKGVSPSDASTSKAPPDTPWSAPSLADFTPDTWAEITATEKRHIAGHYAWAAMMPPDTFGDLKLPHHEPKDGAIVWRGVAAAAARLNQASIPSGDMSAVKNHLARHYRAFDKTPPWEANASAWAAYEKEWGGVSVLTDAQVAYFLDEHGFTAEAAALRTPAPEVKDADPLRWNRQLSKAFDVASERMEPASAEYAWVSRYLDAEVKDLHHGGTFVPSFRMGSFLSALDASLSGWTVDAIRNMTDHGSEAPPYYETIRLNSTKAREFLVAGLRFMRRSDGAKCVMKVEPQWYGLNVTTYARTEQREVSGQLLAYTWERAKQLNFLKGEAFSLGGEFLERTGETWGDLFLDAKALVPIQRAAKLLTEKGAALDSRGILLAGPPGTGKTLAGRVLMNQTPGTTFLWLAARDFYRAGAFGGLTSAFDLAEECAPTILFIEDIDSWIDSYSVDLLKTEMDGIKRRSGIVTILTSNFPHRLPEALIDRPGRFHDVLELTLPGATVRAAMLDAWLPTVATATRVELAGATSGFSGAHLRELVKLAHTLRDEQGIELAAAVTQALAKIRDQRALIDRLRQDARKYVPSRAAQLALARTVIKTAAATAAATPTDSVLDLEDVEVSEFDLGAISAEEEDAFKGLAAGDVLAALRDVIAAEASDGIRKAINSALGRVD